LNTFSSTFWIYELTTSGGVAIRWSDATGHIASALAIQFLWSFFGARIPRPLRIYQLSHLAIALFVAAWPDLRLVFVSATARWLWLLPLLILAAALILRRAWRGDQEARVIAIGGAIMTALEAAELARNVFGIRLPVDVSVAPFGFAAVIVAMSLALSYRFRRVHEELDRLRFRLEEEVEQRTHDLAGARDQALAAYRAKGEFLANISHEIRTPMNGILGTAELMERTPLSEEQRKQLHIIQVSSRALLTLLNDVIDFSRIESESLAIERRAFHPEEVLAECVEIMTPMAEGKRLRLEPEIAGACVPLLGDRNRTRQVLLNLVVNAIKFTPAGAVRIALSSRNIEGGRVEARFTVTDAGPGIAREDLGRLFVAFQQLDGSSSRAHGGAGLGLAISKRLTELMGGTISVESAPGRGSAFSFTIAGERAPDDAVAEPAPARTMADAPALRVLLAEDEAINRIVVSSMLEQLGHHVASVTNGSDALEALERDSFDVVLMDVQMPGLDGLETARRIRASRANIPIIALTARALAGDRERCMDAGMNDYLTKPVKLDDLREALGAVSVGPSANG
jgi:signal transduction histidine kinase/CheY-like chemotaxis protein